MYKAGDRGFPVWDLPAVGRVGVAICYDLRFPESVRLLALQGADIICVPTAWSACSKVPFDRYGLTPGNHLAIAQAYSNRVAVACANRVGTEGGISYVGRSILVDAHGNIVSRPASRRQSATLMGQIDMKASRDKSHGPRSDLFADRRGDLYDEMLGAKIENE